MATIYVKKISGTVYYKAGAWPTVGDNDGTDNLTDINDIVGCDLVVIGEGTYENLELGSNGYLLIKNTGVTIRSIEEGDPEYTSDETVILKVTQDVHGVYSSNKAATLKKFTITHADITSLSTKFGLFSTGTSVIETENVIIDEYQNGVRENSSETSTHTNIQIKNSVDYSIYATGSGVFTYTNPILTGCDKDGINVRAGSTLIYNGIIWGTGLYGVNAPIGSIELYNTIIGAIGLANDTVTTIRQAGGGSASADNCLLLPNGTNEDSVTTGTVSLTDCVYKSPKFKSARRQGFFSIVIDDRGSYEFFKSLAAGVSVPVTWAVSGADNFSEWEEASGYLTTHDIANHTLNHPKLTRMEDVSIASDRADANVSISIDRNAANPTSWTGSITLSDSVNGSDYVINIPADAESIGEVETLVDAYDTTHWTMTLDTANNPKIGSVSATVLDEDYNAAPSTISLDQNAFWYYEVAYSKYLIEQNIAPYVSGWECKTFVHPHNDTSEDLRAYLADSSNFAPLGINAHTGGRGSSAGDYATSDGVDLYNLYGPNPYNELIGNDEIERDSAALGETMQWVGGMTVLYGHHSELTVQNWVDIVDGVESTGAAFYTLRGLIDEVTNLASVSSRTATISWTDNSDFQLTRPSPCVRAGAVIAGVNDGGEEDPWGNATGDNPNIGADQAMSDEVDFAGRFDTDTQMTIASTVSSVKIKKNPSW